MAVETFNPQAVPLPPPTYRQVAVTPIAINGKLVTLAGQVGIDIKTGEVPESFTEQARLAYENILNCLKAAGGSPRDIVHVRHYIVKDTGNPDLDALDVVDRGWGEVWIEFMKTHAGDHLPPDTVLGVASLAKKALLYECECWAYITTT